MSWPAVVWDAPLLRGLSARARAEIEAAGRVVSLRPGETLFRPGDPADALFVVADGECGLWGVRRGQAEASRIRTARRGDVLGEEATVASFASRQLEAKSDGPTSLAEVSLVVLKRAVGREGGELMAKLERSLRRAATLDLLRTATVGAGASENELELLLDAARHVHLARNEHVYRRGDEASEAFLVADGLLSAQTSEDGTRRIEAYLSRGDLFGDEEVLSREPRRLDVVASGPAWVIAWPRDTFSSFARRNAERLAATRRVKSDGVVPKNATTTVFHDLYRLRIARSLLVIDQTACIRCGHCAWSCADAHEDGVSRLVRQGDTLVVKDGPRERAPLLVPNSCQHCKNPSCMIDCPTGAIGRDARGEVFIREELCTGCGSCAKNCPWDNIQMAPRTDAKAFPAVAVKCDLCKGESGGPACVRACPVDAIVRIDPNTTELTHEAIFPARAAAWPWALGAFATGFAMPSSRMTSGVVAGIAIGVLLLQTAVKRTRRGPARPLYIAHVAVGAFAVSAIAMHAQGIPRNLAGALTITLCIASVAGAVGALLAGLLPRAVARLERATVLPEDLPARAKDLDDKIFAALSGQSEALKTAYARALGPYRTALFGSAALALSGRSLREEEARLRAAVPVKVSGLDHLVRLVVERRALRVVRFHTWALRAWAMPHVAFAIASLILLVVHVLQVTR
jgi:Fe-S-cluster-containing dehydrogenase component/CRP-like cAMP-binding protein